MPDSRPLPPPNAAQSAVAAPSATDAATATATPSQAPIERIPKEFGRYRIIDRLGRGGMGVVFRAHDTQLDRAVALKVPFLDEDDDEPRRRFAREARAAATLHHPNICPVYDVGEIGGLPFLTMALIDGRQLDQVLKEGLLPPASAAVLVRKLALAMSEAHDRGVIHRDLKPSNVIIRPDGEPVIMDFGLARRHDDRGSEGLTRRGDILGTLEYMPPEQLDGDNDAVGPAADVYALGVILYEVLTGKRPFTGNATTLLTAILMKPPPLPSEARPGVPARLDEICSKAMARQPADRYASMAEFAAALTEFLRSARPGATPAAQPAAESPAPRPSAPTRPVEVTVVSQGSSPRPRPVVVAAEEAPPAPSSGNRRKRGSAKRKKVEARSNRPVILGAAAVVVVAVVAVVVIRPWGSRPAPDQQTASREDPPATTPTPALAVKDTAKQAEPKAASPVVAKGTASAPPKKAPAAPTPIVVRVGAKDAALAVGERRDVTVEIDRRGYQGPLTVRYEAPPELRVSPRGQLTVRQGGPNPVLSVLLTAEPAGGESHLKVTATPTEGAGRNPVTAQLTLRTAPGPCVRILDIGGDAVIESMAFTPDAALALIGGGADRVAQGGQPAKGGDGGAIRVWDLARGAPLPTLTGHTGSVKELIVSADGKTALSASADDTVALWDLARGRRASQSPRQQLKVLAAAVSPDARRGLVAYPGLLVKVDLEKFHAAGSPIKTAQLTGRDGPEAILAVAVSSDRKGLAGGIDGKLFVLDLTDKAKPKPLAGLTEAVRCAAFSPDGGAAATGSGGVLRLGKLEPGRENAVCVWDAASGSLRWRADEHTGPVVSVAFARDGSMLASGGGDGEVRVWGAADGKPVATFRGHAGRILALAFADDGKTLLSGAADRTVRTWRLP